jgi:hypothetical protein
MYLSPYTRNTTYYVVYISIAVHINIVINVTILTHMSTLKTYDYMKTLSLEQHCPDIEQLGAWQYQVLERTVQTYVLQSIFLLQCTLTQLYFQYT